MSKTIQTTVGAEGNVRLEFAGFIGQECVAEESRIRRGLAELGLGVQAVTGQRVSGDTRTEGLFAPDRAAGRRVFPGNGAFRLRCCRGG
jgi:hypothetical protein